MEKAFEVFRVFTLGGNKVWVPLEAYATGDVAGDERQAKQASEEYAQAQRGLNDTVVCKQMANGQVAPIAPFAAVMAGMGIAQVGHGYRAIELHAAGLSLMVPKDAGKIILSH